MRAARFALFAIAILGAVLATSAPIAVKVVRPTFQIRG
jgi:hypothetical protein